MIIATAGHVDHGKTSLVNALTGVDTDRLQEEKARGLTIDLGFAYINSVSGDRLGFVDVPGHIRFISNMLAGVASIDHALLVVAADDGVMPQTVEHLEILDLLNISGGVIALTKTDRCDAARVKEVTRQIRHLIVGTALESADIYPVSSMTGDGIEQLRLALDVAADALVPRVVSGRFRLAIDRRFTVKGAGIVVTGSVFSGSARPGDELYLLPGSGQATVRVRSLRTQDQPAEIARAGDRCAINIVGQQLTLADIHRGNWLSTHPGVATARMDVRLKALSGEQKPLAHWTPIHIHTAANHVTGRLAVLEPGPVLPGATGLVQLVLDEPLNVCIGDRVIIRDQSALRTLGGGPVLDPDAPGRGRAKPTRLAYLRGIYPAPDAAPDSQTAIARSLRHILDHAATGINGGTVGRLFNLEDDELHQMLQAMPVRQFDDGLIIPEQHLESNVQWLGTVLDAWHEAHPGKPGLPLNQIRQTLPRQWSPSLLRGVVAMMLTRAQLTQTGNLLQRPGYSIQLSDREKKLWRAVEEILQQSATRPPVIHDLAQQLNIQPKALEQTLGQVVKLGLLVRPVKNRFFLPAALDELKGKLNDIPGETFTVQQYRDIAGIGRNLCIEILEYFDRLGITRRIGDHRERLIRP